VWALSRLLPKERLATLQRDDDDASVRGEWAEALR